MGFIDQALAGVANSFIPGSGSIITAIGGWFGFKPNPNDWKGWDSEGRSCVRWIIGDGDSKTNEVANICSFIDAHGMDFLLTATSWEPFEGQKATPAILKAKFERGGQPELGAKLAAYLQDMIDKKNGIVKPSAAQTAGANSMMSGIMQTLGIGGGSTPTAMSGADGKSAATGDGGTPAKKAGMGLVGWLFLIGVAITAFVGFFGGNKNKKRRYR